MTGQNLDGKIVLMGSAFALGLVAGLLLKGGAKEVLERARRGKTHRDYERTVTYDENLPDSLGRREPPPEPEQPGTDVRVRIFGQRGEMPIAGHPAIGTRLRWRIPGLQNP